MNTQPNHAPTSRLSPFGVGLVLTIAAGPASAAGPEHQGWPDEIAGRIAAEMACWAPHPAISTARTWAAPRVMKIASGAGRILDYTCGHSHLHGAVFCTQFPAQSIGC